MDNLDAAHLEKTELLIEGRQRLYCHAILIRLGSMACLRAGGEAHVGQSIYKYITG
jgi:hypothetical protein